MHAVEPLVDETVRDATPMAERAHATLLACILTACLIIATLLGLAIFFAAAARLRSRRLLQANLQMEEEHRRLLQSERLAAMGEDGDGARAREPERAPADARLPGHSCPRR